MADSSPRRDWAPRMWQGCSVPAWLRLLARNRFAISPRFWYIGGVVSCVSLVNSTLKLVQDSVFGSKIDRVQIPPPLFIIGHWRTGTTLLHELLIRDPRHACPAYAECMNPNHFLLTRDLVKRLGRLLLPTHRPMDNMRIGWDNPQEDEFALCMLGLPSPYLTIAFPNHPPQDLDAFDLERLPRVMLKRWKDTFVRFLKQVNYRDGRRLVLKSPTHSCRIPTLLELFPQAQFVHIVRDPHVVFPSTVNLWKSLSNTHGLQVPRFAGLEEFVFSTFVHLYDRIEAGKKLIPPGQFHELRYEDLTADPLGELAKLYTSLNLGGFETARPAMGEYLAANAGYQTNRYPPLSEELREQIRRRWGAVIQRYGY